jgi:phosphoglycerol transferase MdoB-like AlkP superfamily enzyme
VIEPFDTLGLPWLFLVLFGVFWLIAGVIDPKVGYFGLFFGVVMIVLAVAIGYMKVNNPLENPDSKLYQFFGIFDPLAL